MSFYNILGKHFQEKSGNPVWRAVKFKKGHTRCTLSVDPEGKVAQCLYFYWEEWIKQSERLVVEACCALRLPTCVLFGGQKAFTWTLVMNNPRVKMSRLRPQRCLVNLKDESSFPRHAHSETHTPHHCRHHHHNHLGRMDALCILISWCLLTETLIYIQQKCPVVSPNSLFPPASVRGSSYCHGRNGIKYFSKYLSWQSIDQRGRGRLQCVFTRVSGSVTKDVFHAPSNFHPNLLLLDRFFYRQVPWNAAV